MTLPTPNWPLRTRLAARAKLAMARRVWGLKIGRGTVVHPSALLDRTWPRGIHIGADCFIAEEAVVLAHDFTRGLLVDTHVGDRCRLGARSIVMPGITIGADCVVMPGAVVTRDLAPGSVASGNPATASARMDDAMRATS